MCLDQSFVSKAGMCRGKDSGQGNCGTERYFEGNGDECSVGYVNAPDDGGSKRLMAIVVSSGRDDGGAGGGGADGRRSERGMGGGGSHGMKG